MDLSETVAMHVRPICGVANTVSEDVAKNSVVKTIDLVSISSYVFVIGTGGP